MAHGAPRNPGIRWTHGDHINIDMRDGHPPALRSSIPLAPGKRIRMGKRSISLSTQERTSIEFICRDWTGCIFLKLSEQILDMEEKLTYNSQSRYRVVIPGWNVRRDRTHRNRLKHVLSRHCRSRTSRS